MHAAKNSMRSGNCIRMQIRLPPANNRARNFIFHRISTPWSFSHSRSSLVRAFIFSRASSVGIIDIHFDIHRKSLLDTSPLSRRYLRIISSLRFPFIFFFYAVHHHVEVEEPIYWSVSSKMVYLSSPGIRDKELPLSHFMSSPTGFTPMTVPFVPGGIGSTSSMWIRQMRLLRSGCCMILLFDTLNVGKNSARKKRIMKFLLGL